MKKVIIKKWVKVLLIILMFISVILLAGDCESDKLFYLTKIISLIIFIITSNLLLKYGGFNGNF